MMMEFAEQQLKVVKQEELQKQHEQELAARTFCLHFYNYRNKQKW